MKNPRLNSTKFYLFFACIFLLELPWVQGQSRQDLLFKDVVHDFGQILESEGPVTHEFTFTNQGNKPVHIIDVKASCGCTTPGWTREPIAPGASGFVKAQYDPFNRPGSFSKTLTVVTDGAEATVILSIKGNVVPKPREGASEYSHTLGNLKFSTKTLNMGKVYTIPQPTEKRFPVLNTGSKPVKFTGKNTTPAYIQVRMEPAQLAPGQQGMLVVRYDAVNRKSMGYLSDNIMVGTDDEKIPMKSLNVYATVEEYFPPMSDKEMAAAPRASLSRTEIDLGRMKEGAEVITEVLITNYGKTDLEIRQISPNCGCIVADIKEMTLKPGKSQTLSLIFNSTGQKSNQLKSVVVYTNDPRNPVQRINIKGVVD
jgi:hypothetical protein